MIRIFIADDHAMVREGVRRIIEANDGMIVVAEAASGAEVLARIRDVPCDLLLTDMTMRGMSGIDLITQVRKWLPALPILVMSMHETGKIAATALKAGANGYITKGNDPALFPEIVRRVIAGERYVDPVVANRIIFEKASEPMPHEALTEREMQIFHLLVAGVSTTQISEELFISPKTVSSHKKRIMAKFGAQSSADLIKYSIEHHLIAPPNPTSID